MQKSKAVLLLLVPVVFAPVLSGQTQRDVIFPEPLHLVKEVEDPVSGATVTVEEYFVGNRAIAINGDRVAISDYGEGTLTEIDHTAGTYSIATFEAIAEAKQRLRPNATRGAVAETLPRRETVTPRKVAGRVAETFRTTFDEGELRRIEMSFDPQIELSREAIDVITGAAWPNEPGRASLAAAGMAHKRDERIRTSSGVSPAASRYRLPLAQTLEFELDGERLEVVTRAVRIDHDLPPSEQIAIPADARKVEAHLIQIQRLSEELDRLPGTKEQ